MSFTGNSYCKYCGDMINEKDDPLDDVCSNCYVKELEDATK